MDDRDTKAKYNISEDLLHERVSATAEARKKKRQELIRQQQEKKDPARIKLMASKRRRVALWTLVIIAIFAVVLRMGLKVYTLNQEKSAVEESLKALQDKQSKLERELDQVESDEYVEQAARSDLHMIKPGETLFIINENDAATDSAIETEDVK